MFNHSGKVIATAISLACLSSSVYATNGMEATGLGQVHKAMGGAAVGNPQNTMSMATNPASINNISSGYDVGAEIFNPKREGKHNGALDNATELIGQPAVGGTVFEGNGREYFLIPEFAWKKRSNGGNKSFGVAVYGSGGMNTKYDGANPPVLQNYLPPSFGAPAGAAGNTPFNCVWNASFNSCTPSGVAPSINLEQLVIAPTMGIKLNDRHSLGLSLNLTHQRFKAQGLEAFANPGFSTDITSVTNRGIDSSSGVGATIGWQGQLSDKVTVGAAYRTKTNMSKFDKYKGLFTNGGELNLPAALSVGLGVKATPKTTLAMDIKHIFYSDVESIGNKATIVPAGSPGRDPVLLGGKVGFGWDDQTIFKLGVKHQLNPKLALMAGVNYGKNPVSADGTNLNLLAPGVTESHLSLGFEKQLTKHSKLSGSYIRTFSKTVKAGDVPAGDIPQQYDLEMNQHAIGIGYSRTF